MPVPRVPIDDVSQSRYLFLLNVDRAFFSGVQVLVWTLVLTLVIVEFPEMDVFIGIDAVRG